VDIRDAIGAIVAGERPKIHRGSEESQSNDWERKLFVLATLCWQKDPASRPTLAKVLEGPTGSLFGNGGNSDPTASIRTRASVRQAMQSSLPPLKHESLKDKAQNKGGLVDVNKLIFLPPNPPTYLWTLPNMLAIPTPWGSMPCRLIECKRTEGVNWFVGLCLR